MSRTFNLNFIFRPNLSSPVKVFQIRPLPVYLHSRLPKFHCSQEPMIELPGSPTPGYPDFLKNSPKQGPNICLHHDSLRVYG